MEAEGGEAASSHTHTPPQGQAPEFFRLCSRVSLALARSAWM